MDIHEFCIYEFNLLFYSRHILQQQNLIVSVDMNKNFMHLTLISFGGINFNDWSRDAEPMVGLFEFILNFLSVCNFSPPNFLTRI